MAPEVKLNSIRMQRANQFNNIEAMRLQEFIKSLEKTNRYEKRVKDEEARLVEYTLERIKDSSGLSPQSEYLRKLEEKEEHMKRVHSAPAYVTRGKSRATSSHFSHKRRPFSTKTAGGYRGHDDTDGRVSRKQTHFAGIGNRFGAKNNLTEVKDSTPEQSDDDLSINDDSDSDDDDGHNGVQSKGTSRNIAVPSGKQDSLLSKRKQTNPATLIQAKPNSDTSNMTPYAGQNAAEARKAAQKKMRGTNKREDAFVTATQGLMLMQVTSIRRLEKCKFMMAAEKGYQQDILEQRLEDFKKLYPISN